MSPTERRAAELLSVLADLTGFLGRSAWPVADVVIRWWIARPMIVSGLLLAHDWNTALTLAAHEYPISWLDPGTEAALGIFLQLAGGISLVAGLGTRGGALAIVALEIATRVYYVEADLDLFRVALAAGYVLSGPGPFSLDRLFGQGLARSPVPFAAAIIRVFEKTRAPFRDGYLLGLRLWLALGLSVGALPEGSRLALSPWVAGFTAAALFGAIGPVLAIPLALGAMTRLAAVVVIVAAGWDAMASGGEFAASWTLALAFLLVSGPGPLSLDGAIFRRLKRRFLELSVGLDGLPHVVIVGAGFGGVACARALRHAPARVTLIDRHNFHLFQPLLYQVATAALSPGDIAIPIRSMFRDQPNARVMLGTVTDIDIAARRVLTRSHAVGYDYLVAATGATHSYFGQAAWARYAPGLKRVEDATEIRRRVLEAFERAEVAEDERERQALLSFVIVGAGPTGVELAGAIAELARFGMSKDFRNIDPSAAEIVLVQAAPRILPAFPEALSRRAQESLERMGVKVLIGSMVRGIDADGVLLDGGRVHAKTVLWAAGVAASPVATWLRVEADGAGRVAVAGDLSVPNLPNVFVIGDAAASKAWAGAAVPGLAPAAKQQGAYVGKLIAARLLGRPELRPFVYRHRGSLATIGRKSAVADFGRIKLGGAAAWWLWGLVHLLFLVGARNRLAVILNWGWSYFSFRASTRLITEPSTRDGRSA